MKDNISKRVTALFIIFLLPITIINLLSFDVAYAFEKSNYMLKIGMAVPETDTPLNQYWKEGLTYGFGRRLLSAWIGTQLDIWFGGEMTEFEFNEESKFPINSYAIGPQGNFSAESIHLYFLYMQFKIFLVNPDKNVVPYMHINYGYFHRSNTILRFDFPSQFCSELKFTDAFGSSLGLGLEFKANQRVKILLDLSLLSASTSPSVTNYTLWSLGILFR